MEWPTTVNETSSQAAMVSNLMDRPTTPPTLIAFASAMRGEDMKATLKS
jgi:hypothetical protein